MCRDFNRFLVVGVLGIINVPQCSDFLEFCELLPPDPHGAFPIAPCAGWLSPVPTLTSNPGYSTGLRETMILVLCTPCWTLVAAFLPAVSDIRYMYFASIHVVAMSFIELSPVFCVLLLVLYARWCTGCVVRALDLWSRDRRFNSRPVHCRET